MQLHRLEMTAIGPYAGTEVIDFSAVGRAGLFLLEGPDRLGQVDDHRRHHLRALRQGGPGLRRRRADPLPPRRPPHGPGRHARLRDPVRHLPGAAHPPLRAAQVPRRAARPCSSPRSSCGASRRPTTSLGGELLSTNIGDCDDEITRAVGLTRDQFVQTVILPQGEFATFLRARSEDKGKLLEKVFGTAFFRRVQDEIVEAGRVAQARRQSAVDEIRMAVQAFAVSAGLETDRRDALLEAEPLGPRARWPSWPRSSTSSPPASATRASAAARRSRATGRWPTWSARPGCACSAASGCSPCSARTSRSGKRAVHFDAAARPRSRGAPGQAGRRSRAHPRASREGALKRAEAALRAARSRVRREPAGADRRELRVTAAPDHARSSAR